MDLKQISTCRRNDPFQKYSANIYNFVRDYIRKFGKFPRILYLPVYIDYFTSDAECIKINDPFDSSKINEQSGRIFLNIIDNDWDNILGLRLNLIVRGSCARKNYQYLDMKKHVDISDEFWKIYLDIGLGIYDDSFSSDERYEHKDLIRFDNWTGKTQRKLLEREVIVKYHERYENIRN